MNDPDLADRQSLRGRDAGPRIAILVLACLMPVYDRCIRTIRATWGSRHRDGIDVFYVYGGLTAGTDTDLVPLEQVIGEDRPELSAGDVWASNDLIVCGAGDVYADQADCILRKRLIGFGYLASRLRYDFVYTVCASSYVDVDALQRYVAKLPANGVYHGPLSVHAPTGSPFVSGASILLSRDIAANLADDALAILASDVGALPDDVAIGHWIADRYCAEPGAAISRRIGEGRKATDNQTFVLPDGVGMVDYVHAPVHSQVPQPRAYHYHFHTSRLDEMEAFHRRFFAS
jgi:hypothetical protein